MSDEQSLREIRLEKLARLRELGADPYAVERFEADGSAQSLLDGFTEGKSVSFAGRLVSMRLMGKAAFAHLSDGEGRIQGYFKKDDLGETAWEVFGLLDVGDHVGVTGELFLTKTGEKSVHVRTLTPLSKSLQNLPLGKEKDGQHWYGLSDIQERYRHRHLDLVCNQEARKMLLDRSRIVTAVRNFFDSRGFFEVETPFLQVNAGGAAARTFETHYNAYDMDVKLRISLELYLKRIICGDVPKVYEIGRVFRNEGVSNRHNPEFTLLEWYEAYANLEDVMATVEELFRAVCQDVYGADVLRPGFAPERVRPSRFSHKSDYANSVRIGTHHAWLRFSPLGVNLQAPDPGEIMKLNPGDDASNPFGYEHGAKLVSGTVESITREGTVFLHVHDSATLQLGEGTGILGPGLWTVTVGGRSASWDEEIPERIQKREATPVLDFSKPWTRVDLLTEIEKACGLTASDLSSLEDARKALGSREVKNPSTGKRINADDEQHLGGLIEKLLEVFVEPNLQEPTFVVGYPIETSPLAKKDPKRPGFTRRFEGYVLGREICNAFSEINDPIDQRERFEQQVGERDRGDEEAHPMDEDYIYALEGGMPPTGGCGIGIDRLAMLLTGADNLREILLFPTMKPRHAAEEDDDD